MLILLAMVAGAIFIFLGDAVDAPSDAPSLNTAEVSLETAPRLVMDDEEPAPIATTDDARASKINEVPAETSETDEEPVYTNVIRGSVISPNGSAVVDASVYLGKLSVFARATWSLDVIKTDSSGRFEIPGCAPGEHVVSVFKENYLTAYATAQVTAPETYVTIVLGAGGSLNLSVTKDGKPVEAQVKLKGVFLKTNTFDDNAITTWTNEQGRLSLHGIPEGSAQLSVEINDPHIRKIHRAIDVVEGLTTDVALTFDLQDATISGYLTDESGQALSGLVNLRIDAAAGMTGWSGLSDETGYFEFSNIPPGPFIISASQRGSTLSSMQRGVVRAEESLELTLKLRQGTSVVYTVKNIPANSAPYVLLLATDFSLPRDPKVSDAADFLRHALYVAEGGMGTFRMKSVEPGDYMVIALSVQNHEDRTTSVSFVSVSVTILDVEEEQSVWLSF